MTITTAREFLLKAVKMLRLSPAYLITGLDSRNRRDLAKIFVQAIFCTEKGQNSEPCGRCLVCRKVIEEKHPDLFFIAGEGKMGLLKIEQVRKLKSEIYLSPYQAKYRIYLLEIETLQEEAANAFLKTLEEPPQTAIIILLARTEREFLPTILSRLTKIRLPEPEMAPVNITGLKKMMHLSWQDPSEIFSLTKEVANYDESELREFLENLVNNLKVALEFKEGMRSKEETPEIIRILAERMKSSQEIRNLLEEVLGKRQDILRGRVSPRLALDNIFINLAQCHCP
ncbi:MAG: hypothetical protein V2A65_05425 [Candidatus Omnitrophota bacterium]